MKSVFLTVLMFSTLPVWANECPHEAERRASIPTANIKRVVIEAERGALNVEGERNRQSIDAVGRACAERSSLLEDVVIDTSTRGDTVYIRTNMPDISFISLGTGNETWLDLTVRVPEHVALDIRDGSGVIAVRNVGRTEIDDGSGGIKVDGVNGSLAIDDGSGPVYISNVQGDVTVRDGSGEVIVNNVTGDLTIPDDGSGQLVVTKVKGNVRIANDGSGAIHIRDVERNVSIGDEGSGELVVENVRGSLSVKDTGSGGVRFVNIDGNVEVPD